MNFDEKYSELMRNVLFERQGSIVLYPGGFKPPHKGHFEALKYLQSKFDGQLGVIFIGAPEREGVTAQHSQKIWEIYGNYLEFPIETEISPISPVKSVYDYADEHKNEMIIVGAGEEDMARYNYFEKNKETYPNVVVSPVPPQFGRISGTATRQNLSDTTWIPDQAMERADEILSILGANGLN